MATRNKFQDWPEDVKVQSTKKIIELYNNGFAGATKNPEAAAQLKEMMLQPDADKVVHTMKMADTGAGKLVIPFVHVLEMFPNCWPGAQGQARGDCVSWSTRNAALLTMCCDIVSGIPDAKTGKLEEKPEVPPEGILDGVLSTEAFYWYRGYDGDGWHCPAAAQIAITKAGLVVRKNYPDMGIDLTTYSGKKAGAYGRKSPGQEVQKITSEHLVHQATNSREFAATRDLLFNGFGVTTCGSEGISDQRDENGVSKKKGSWAHAMAYIGADDRDVIKQLCGEPLYLDLNSWAKWNRGNRDIYQSAALVPPEKKDLWIKCGIVNSATGNIMIPEGSCWIRQSEMKNREMIAMAGALGWQKKNIDPIDTYV